MNMKTETETLLEFLSKILSLEWQTDISPNAVYVGFQVCKVTGAPFKECVLAAVQAEKKMKKII